MKIPIKQLSAGISSALLACLFLSAAFPSFAAAETTLKSVRGPGTSQKTQRLTMGVGKSAIIDLPGDAAEVFIADPKIANAVVRSSRKLYVLGNLNGQTTIFALDKEGRQLISLEVNIVGRDIAELRSILKTAMPNSDITVESIYDTVILRGSVDSAIEAQKAQDIAEAFVGYTTVGAGGVSGGGSNNVNFSNPVVIQGKLINSITIRGKDQVMLKVTVAEVQRNVIKQLGVDAAVSWGKIGSTFASNTNLSLNQDPVSDGFTQLNNQFGNTSIASTIKAYERQGVARILAEPTVTAISGESAKFTAGGTIPQIVGVTQGSSGSICTLQVQQTPYGVTLNFTPVVQSEGRITLHIATEVTEIDGEQNVRMACNVSTSGFRTRKHETTVELPSGGSIVSAGLISQSSRQLILGTPGLMNLPVLGTLFRSRDYQRQETELMIFVTPYIAKTLRPDQISKPDDGFADAADPQSWFLGRVNRIYSTTSNPEIVNTFKGRVGFIND